MKCIEENCDAECIEHSNRCEFHRQERMNQFQKFISVPEPFHTHVTEQGMLVKCYHKSKTMLANWQFWVGLTLGFPLEHLLWEKVPIFKDITHWLGL